MELTTEQKQHICAELARRMGWTPPTSYDAPWPERFLYWLSPDGQSNQEEAPDSFTDAAASRALVEWLRKDECRFYDFAEILIEVEMKLPRQQMDWQEIVIAAMTAPLETIALAAARALGIRPDASNAPTR